MVRWIVSALVLLAGCKGVNFDLNKLPCEAGACAEGYVCHPELDVCVVPVNVDCSPNATDALCPAQVTTGSECANDGSFLSCDASRTDCFAGCRTCEDGKWSACSVGTCSLGELESCGSCSDNCEVSVLNADPRCEVVDALGSCSYTACENGFFDADQNPSNGCECQITNGGVEIPCNGIDEDCDGSDLQSGTDEHCAFCGNNCSAFDEVVSGRCALRPTGYTCEITECTPGYADLDNVASTGCEGACVPSGVEVCDGIDNDCDGARDNVDLLELTTVCDNAYPGAQVSLWACDFGECRAEHCAPGFNDLDGVGGCEYACPLGASIGAVETCDGVDNDCNGIVDDIAVDATLDCSERYSTAADVVTWRCLSGCAIIQCTPGFGDVNGDPQDGCEANCADLPEPLPPVCQPCGNGYIDEGEACDDGVVLNSDDWAAVRHCNADCSGLGPYCGDGELDSPHEACDDSDDGNSDAWAVGAHCNATCTGLGPYCGDGIRHTIETCDGDCPVSCEDGNPCTTNKRNGSDSACNVTCAATTISACADNDGCCAASCDWWDDNSCTPLEAFGGEAQRIDRVPPETLGAVTVSVANVNWDANRDGSVNSADSLFLTSSPTSGSGVYSVTGNIPANSTITIHARVEQNAGDDGIGFNVPTSIATRSKASAAQWRGVSANVPVAKFSWLANVATECGLYNNFEEAAGETSINTDFITSASIIGFLKDSNGNPVSGVPKHAITVEFDNNVGDSLPGFLNSSLPHVCFLDEFGGTLIGTDHTTSSDTGAFVVFRLTVSPTSYLGEGTATVRVIDYGIGVEFIPVTIPLLTSNIGVVELVTTDAGRDFFGPQVDFDSQIYPLFTARGCVGCHADSTGAPAYNVLRPDASDPETPVRANWNDTADNVYYHLTGPGRFCGTGGCSTSDTTHPVNNPTDKDNYLNNAYPRVCVDSVRCSLFLIRPQRLRGVHPLDGFDETTPADVALVRTMEAWIAQGARRTASVDFSQDVLPIFERRGCTASCHDSGQPGAVTRGGYVADFVGSSAQVAENLTGPGTSCYRVSESSASFPRVCTDEPMRSLLVRRMMDDHDISTPGPFVPPSPSEVSDPWDVGMVLLWLAQGAGTH